MSCKVIRKGGTYRSKQGLDTFEGVSAQSAGAQGICLHVITIPPGGRAKPHLHARHESTVYVLEGRAGMWHGEGLREHVWMEPGDFLYIPANTPHLPYNASETSPCVGVVARTDPNEQESVTMLDMADPGVAVPPDFAARYTAAWRSQDPAAVAAFYAPEGSLAINAGAPAVGRRAIADAAQSFMTRFPDLHVVMDDLVPRGGNRAEYHWTLTGTSKTGSQVRISGVENWQLGPDGLIAVSDGRFDAADFERQLARDSGLE
jgi:uncharacterized RmlC-like cupin family protein/nuclear transport factor 2 (NTF2) superfamily protein